MISPEYLCRRVCVDVLEHYPYHKGYPLKPEGWIHDMINEHTCENSIATVKGTPINPGGWIHNMISPEAARMRVNMYM